MVSTDHGTLCWAQSQHSKKLSLLLDFLKTWVCFFESRWEYSQLLEAILSQHT